jgi:hypothetical protein
MILHSNHEFNQSSPSYTLANITELIRTQATSSTTESFFVINKVRVYGADSFPTGLYLRDYHSGIVAYDTGGYAQNRAVVGLTYPAAAQKVYSTSDTGPLFESYQGTTDKVILTVVISVTLWNNSVPDL